MESRKLKVDSKYKISSHGKYHKGVNYCPDCNKIPDDLLKGHFYDNACGFCETEIGLLVVIECPSCFVKWSFHSDADVIMYFLGSIDSHTNKHFKNNETQKISAKTI